MGGHAMMKECSEGSGFECLWLWVNLTDSFSRSREASRKVKETSERQASRTNKSPGEEAVEHPEAVLPDLLRSSKAWYIHPSLTSVNSAFPCPAWTCGERR
jgi:hypothetical protein